MASSLPGAPLVSVVLCARDAALRLPRVLEALCRQTLAREAFEVVVVDDGSTDGTLEEARAFEPRLPLRVAHQRAAGVASARNHGIFCARGVVVLFLDEAIPERGLLEAHLDAHRRYPEPRFAVVGVSRTPADLAGDPLLRFLAETQDLEWRRGPAPAGELRGSAHFRADGASLKRILFLERGVFNPSFRRCGEDVELAYRLSRHGLEVVHAPRAVATIATPTDLDAACARLREVGAAAVLLDRLHDDPALRLLTGVAGAAAAWRELAPVHHAILRSAREVDRFVRLREEEGLAVDAHHLALLHRGYLAALRASRVRGIVEAQENPGKGPLDARSLGS